MFDLLFRNALLVDGTGAPPRPADVGVEKGRIAAVGDRLASEAATVVELDGLVLAPGFIDLHTHSDYWHLVEPFSLSKLHEGVTTDVSGNCGFSPFPLDETARAREAARWKPLGVTVDWSDFASYRRRCEQVGLGINHAFFVGHGALRAHVVGHVDRPATASELGRMKELLARELNAGAIGLSTGLIYAPGCFAGREEIASLCEVVVRRGGLYASHIRGEGATLLEAIQEALWICQESGVRTQISHLKASRPQNWPKLDRALALIEYAQSEGLPVMADRYPYEATSAGVDQLLPEWAYEGGLQAELARLDEPRAVHRIREEMAHKFDADYYSRVQIADAAGHPELNGRRLDEFAAERGLEPDLAVFELLRLTQGRCECVYFVLSEQNMRRVLSREYVMVASDAEARATVGPASQGLPHPRAYGTFARVLGRLSRDEGLFPLEEAVRKMTSLSADQLGLTDRGRIAPGLAADLASFDPARILDRATYTDPHRYSEGVVHVVVNGRLVLRDGQPTGERPGRILTAKGPARPAA
ncbi:MAG: D-aminoacylase [Candidatus Riflebacteria bacterium]|nr:D-aminoacylase [Candidatus Riflebacteria bacterium]